MQSKIAIQPLAALFSTTLKAVKPVGGAVRRGATKTVARAAGVQPEALAANPIKNTYRAATLAGMPTYRRVAHGAGLAAAGATGVVAGIEGNRAYQENVVQPYNMAVKPLVSQGLLSPEQEQQGLAAVRQGLWNQAYNMLPFTGNDATAAQRGAIYGEMVQPDTKAKPSAWNTAATIATNLSPVGIAKHVGTATAKKTVLPTPEQARQATLKAFNPQTVHVDGSNAFTSEFAVTARRDALAAANKILPSNQPLADRLAGAIAGMFAASGTATPEIPPAIPPEIPSTPSPPPPPPPPPSAAAPPAINYRNLGIGSGAGAAGGLAMYELIRKSKKKHAAERLLALLGGGALGGVAAHYWPKAS